MPILFGVVSRGTTILAKHANCAGNFTEVIEQVLSKISPENTKMTYCHDSYQFHYISESRIIFLCVTDDNFERSRAFAFLSEIKRRFTIQYGTRALTALPYAMNSEFSQILKAQMRYFSSESEDPSKVEKVQSQVDELKGIMVRNIDQLASRGEHLELLIDKTEDLSEHSVTFKTTSRNLARSMWWKNIKFTIILVLVLIFVLYLVVSISCGGLAWQKCVK